MAYPYTRWHPAPIAILLYAILGIAWTGFARRFVPPIIATAYSGRSRPALNRLFRRPSGHHLGHYLDLWSDLSGAVLLALLLHLALVLAVVHIDRRHARARPTPEASREAMVSIALLLFALAFLALAVLSGPRHDYVADLEIWGVIIRGGDPWWLLKGRGFPLNAYGPLFNSLALLVAINPLAPKLLFSFGYLSFVLGISKSSMGSGRSPGLLRAGLIALVLNPFPWIEIAYFGHFDVLVGLACVAAVHWRTRGRDAPAGLCLASGVLLKYLPIVILPCLVSRGRRVRPHLLAWSVTPILLGMAASVLAWGPSTFRPITFAATRGSTYLSVFRFLRGNASPLRLFGSASPDVDWLATPCLVLAVPSVIAWCELRRIGPATASSVAVLTTLLFYRVGFPNYHMVAFLLIAYDIWGPPNRARHSTDPFLRFALACYLGWLALFDLFNSSVGGVLHPDDRWGWVEDVAGLPSFFLVGLLLIALLRSAPAPSGPAFAEHRGKGGEPAAGEQSMTYAPVDRVKGCDV